MIQALRRRLTLCIALAFASQSAACVVEGTCYFDYCDGGSDGGDGYGEGESYVDYGGGDDDDDEYDPEEEAAEAEDEQEEEEDDWDGDESDDDDDAQDI
jgi:hypothetical protein